MRSDAENSKAYRTRHPEKARAEARRATAAYEKTEKGRARKKMKNAARGHRGVERSARDYAAVLLGDPCSYCGGPADTIDHIEPTVFGGSQGWENLTAACRSCNSRKNANSLLLVL